MIALRLWWRLSRRQESQRLTVALALVAFAVATGALLTVLGGLRAFMARPDSATYILLAQIATVILIVPVITLGGAAARLSVARRDQRLAALRLAGATSGQVGVMAVADAAAQALVGSALGTILYLVALPGIALLRFQGRSFAWSELWVGFAIMGLVIGGVVLLSTASAALGLAKVIISPLGVAQRISPKRLTWFRLIIAAAVIIAWVPLFGNATLAVTFVFFGLCFAVLNLVGPLILGLIGRAAAAQAKSVPALLGARRLVDDPKSAWRSVGGVALATFVAGVLSIAPALSSSMSGGPEQFLSIDLMTGAILTLVIAALLAAVSSGVTQAARVLDHQDQYRMLHLAGTDISIMESARLKETWIPLLASVAIAAGTSMIMVIPIGISLILTNPMGLLMFCGGVAVSLAMVMGAVRLSQPMVAKAATLN